MIYTRWDITDLGNGRARFRMETNDNNDDGYRDDEPVTVLERETSLGKALEMAGHKSHQGLYGQPVSVYLNGRKI